MPVAGKEIKLDVERLLKQKWRQISQRQMLKKIVELCVKLPKVLLAA
jgi:hypothetical protein